MKISQYITGTKLLVLTGAGASVPLGKYTTRAFLLNFPEASIAGVEQRANGAGEMLRQVIQESRGGARNSWPCGGPGLGPVRDVCES